MNSNSRVRDLAQHRANGPRYEAILRRHIQAHFGEAGAVQATLGTVDGIELASYASGDRRSRVELAAMASSLLAVSAAAGREVGHTACERVIVQSASGVLLIRPVGESTSLILCMASSSQVVLGRTLWIANDISRSAAAVGT